MVDSVYFPLGGGLDLVTQHSSLKPGNMILCGNYDEGAKTGYSRIDGYERYDGQDSPSTATTTAIQETRRTAISAPPGSGSILGVWVYKGEVYCFRNNALATAAVMYKATSSGWEAVTMSHVLYFDAGTTAFTVGDTLSGATASATIGAYIKTSGAWDGSAVGVLFLDSVSVDDFVNNEAITDTSGGAAVANGVNAEVTILPNGKYEFVNYNFFGASDLLKMYWVDGVNKAFQFDGTTIVEIPTGMTTDTPNHVCAHKNHLFLSFPGGSVQHSSITDPTSFSVVLGAAEIGVGDNVTGFSSLPGGILGIFCRNSTWLLYGSSVDDWELKNHSYESGCIEWSLQRMRYPVYADDRGITTLSNTDAYGDFASANIAKQIHPLLKTKLSTIVGSIRVKEKNQYRIFFSSGMVFTVTFRDDKVSSVTKQNYQLTISCSCQAEDASGNEILFFGATNGYVYQLDKGTNFDGSAVKAFFRTPYYNYRTPNRHKRFRRLNIEFDAGTSPSISLTVAPDFSFGNRENIRPVPQDLTIQGGGGTVGDAVVGEVVLGGSLVGDGNVYVDGHGKNMALLFSSSAIYEKPHTIHGITVEYSVLGRRR